MISLVVTRSRLLVSTGFLSSFTVQLFGTHDDPMKLNAFVKPNKLKPTVPNPTVVNDIHHSSGKNFDLTLVSIAEK